MPDLPSAARAVMLRQEGVAARRQLLLRGMDAPSVDRARAAGRLRDLHPGYGIYSMVPTPFLTDDAFLIAAMLATGSRGLASHQTAAYRWGLIPAPPSSIHLATRMDLVPPDGVVVHRTVLRTTDVGRLGRFRTTTVERTLLDLAAGYDLAPLVAALEQAEFLHRRRPEHILAVLRRGHPGSARLREALDRHVPGYGQARSRLERRFRRLLIAHGIRLPDRNRRVGPWTVDCLWADLLVVVELDGGQHDFPGQGGVDARRDLWLRRHGYIVRRYTYKQVFGPDCDLVVADLLAAFAEAGDAQRRAASEVGAA